MQPPCCAFLRIRNPTSDVDVRLDHRTGRGGEVLGLNTLRIGRGLPSCDTRSSFASTGRLRHARPIYPTQQRAVERELDKARRLGREGRDDVREHCQEMFLHPPSLDRDASNQPPQADLNAPSKIATHAWP